MTSSDGPENPEKPRRKRRQKPHNAKMPQYTSLSDLIEAIGSEQRLVPFAGGEVMMSRRELSFRIMIAKAVDKEVPDLAQLLRLMVKYPELSATVVATIVFRGGSFA